MHCDSFPEAGFSSFLRFLPTHLINEGMGLCYAVIVDGGLPEIRDMNAEATSRPWMSNVLNGYAKAETTHDLAHEENLTATIYLLDPGMVLSQVRVFTGD